MQLCPECFSGKVEVGEHQSSHGYRVVDDMGFSLFNGGGTAKELLLILDLIERHGYGNWEDVAKSYNSESSLSHKSPSDIQQQFSAIFLHGNLGKFFSYIHERGVKNRDSLRYRNYFFFQMQVKGPGTRS